MRCASGSRGKPIGVAHYSSTSQIALACFPNRPEPIDRAFYLRRLAQAIAHRERVVQNSDAYRLVFSEADLLPGLIVDRYGPYLVMQTLSQGMDRARDVIADCLDELLAPAGILARNDASVRGLEGLPLETKLLAGEMPERVRFRMNGLTLEADLKRGQKTGVYLDQRENYLAVAGACARPAAKWKDAGLLHLHRRFRFACRRETWNRLKPSTPPPPHWPPPKQRADQRHRQHTVPASRRLRFLGAAQGRYSTIVLDPPAFAKSRKQMEAAARGYKEINLRALRLLEPGGILVTCSCSHHMSEAMLLEIVAPPLLRQARRSGFWIAAPNPRTIPSYSQYPRPCTLSV